MKKIVLIVGASHSGSTLLSLMLGSHSAITSLGEVTRTFYEDTLHPAPEAGKTCSCGQPADHCRFWGSVGQRLAARPASDLLDFYRRVCDRFTELYGDQRILMDSSKSLRALRALAEAPDFEVKPLFLVKDVRNYAISMRAKNGGGVFRHFLYWQKKNIKIAETLRALGVPYLGVSYERLCFDPEAVLQELCVFLDIGAEALLAKRASGEHHVLEGNAMRKHEAHNPAIQYDARWLARRDWLLPAILLPWVMRLNQALVYRSQAPAG